MASRLLRTIPLVALLAGALLTGITWQIASEGAQDRFEAQFSDETERIANSIEERFKANEQVLFGGLGLWNAQGDVNRTAWRDYVASLRLPEQYPGIQGIGYARFIAAEDLAAHEAEMRATPPPPGPLLRPDLFSNYTVHDVTGARHEADLYSSIIYLEPFDLRNQNALGLDMYSHPERRLAMDRAITTGDDSLSGRVTLVQEIDEDVQPGFLLYVPHYAAGPTDTIEQRKAAILGFVYSPLRATDMIRGVLGEDTPLVTFRIYDGEGTDEASLLYDEGGTTGDEARASTLFLAGHSWTVEYRNAADFVADDRPANLVLAGGSVITVLIFGLVLVQSRVQRRAEKIAQGMTTDLRASEHEKSELADHLARSNRELEQFAYVASHDLQEPLRTVASYLELLEVDCEDELSPDAMGYVDSALRGTDRMLHLIQDLLEYSRAGGEPASGPAAASQCLNAARDELAVVLSEQEVQLEAASLPEVKVRASDLVRVFANLISNAVKYRHPERPCQVRVDWAQEGAMARFWVQDNGIGVAAKDVETIFVMFKRLQRADDIPGSGMGLSICQRIVESYGGRMWVESDDAGSRFNWTLPLVDP